MASEAFARLTKAIAVANRLLVADDGKNREHGRTDFYHAAWAGYIASWDSYVKSVCKEFIAKSNVALSLGLANDATIAYQAIHSIASDLFDYRLTKLNTPNFENTREFILDCTGLDTYALWRWDRKSLTNINIKDLLNEAVRVRHSFAHGFPVRNLRYLNVIDGSNAVTYRKAIFVRSLLSHLSRATDQELDNRLQTLFARPL